MVHALLEGRGAPIFSGFTLKAERGYRNLSTMTSLFRRGINCILKCHPLSGSAFLDVTWNEENDEEEDNCGTGENVEDGAVSTKDTTSRISTTIADRRRASVGDDRPEARTTA